MMMTLQDLRRHYTPKIPALLQKMDEVECQKQPKSEGIRPEIAKLFPHLHKRQGYGIVKAREKPHSPLKLGVVFSGGPAAGGHNVLAGLFDAVTEMHQGSKLIGFLGGFSGLLKNQQKELMKGNIDAVRNQGGFDLIGTGRTKVETPEDLQKAKASLEGFDALIVIGGDDSNTNAAILAEYLLKEGLSTSVIGVPKTIDGDLQSADIEITFGFDSATKTYAEAIGNICRDALSTRKYYHFIKLMGRSASHIALECAVLTQPNLTLIGEEKKSLKALVQEIVHLIRRRKEADKEFGVVLIPEGLIEFIPQLNIDELPEKIKEQLSQSKDPHGNLRLSQIATEELLALLVTQELKAQNFSGKIEFQHHFLGYEGRSCLPTNFDANYTYALGKLAALAARDQATGVICALKHLNQTPDHWIPVLSPLLPMLHIEERGGEKKPVIEKVLIDVKGKHFLHFLHAKPMWELEDRYQFPGPIQFFGSEALTDSCPRILSDR